MKRSYIDVARVQKNHRIRNRLKAIAYLEENPCIDCGETRIPTLDFDHVDPANKKFNVGIAISGSHRSWKTILTEIQKCEVRCSNCHRMRTAKQFNWYASLEEELCSDQLSDPNKPVRWHGTKNGYSYHKCRCDDCKKAHREYQRHYNAVVSPHASNVVKG